MPNVLTMDQVTELTGEFFKRHWNVDVLELSQPAWKDDRMWRFEGPLPGRESPGCYALMAGDEVIYIGVGASNPGGRYEHHGLGSRISYYWRRHESREANRYQPIKKWRERGLDAIRVIEFPSDVGYLAIALEIYLLAHLTPKPKYNAKSPGRKVSL